MKQTFVFLLILFISTHSFSKENVALIYKDIFQSLEDINWDNLTEDYHEIVKNGWNNNKIFTEILIKEKEKSSK